MVHMKIRFSPILIALTVLCVSVAGQESKYLYDEVGNAFASQGKYYEAIQAYDKAIELDPKFAQAWNDKGNALYGQGKYDDAIKLYDEAIRLDPKFAQAWNNKGKALYGQGKYNDAVKLYDEAIRLNTNYTEAWGNKGNALKLLGRTAEAEAAFAKASAMGQENPAKDWFKMSQDLYENGTYNESLEAANESIKLDPNYAPPWYIKGMAFFMQGKYNESIKAIDKALVLYPNFGEALYNRHKVLRALNRSTNVTATSEDWWEMALDLEGYIGPSLFRPTIVPQETIKVMTYNILSGAGVDPAFEKWATNNGYPGNRLSRVIEVIKTANPDILGIQEVNGWDKGNPSIIQQVADELHMSYFICKSNKFYPDFHVALLTKFNIKEAKDYPDNFINGALRAEVVTPQGRSIQVFVVHFVPPIQTKGGENPYDPLKNIPRTEIQDREVSFLVEKMKPYANVSTILVGDMNKPPSQLGAVLHKANLSLAAAEPSVLIDSIWISPALISNRSMLLPDNLTHGASDHRPIIAEIDIPS
jgi:tetratricopeptide (TPR) repeat protein/endonuclease/exonuclease/phosphatase family metal-dependent hydrolase